MVSSSVAEEESAQRMPSNLEVIQKLSFQIGDSLAGMLGEGDSVRVLVRPVESAWYVEGPLLRAFAEHGRFPTLSLSAGREVDIGLLTAKVEYANVRGHGFFAQRVLDRTVRVEFTGKIVDTRSGTIVVNRDFAGSARDTVEFSELERLESAGIPGTHGVVPAEGFFSSILEPLVMIGAVAVAVFLLFRVRS